MHRRLDEGRLRGEVVSDTAPKPCDTLSQRCAMPLARRLEKYWHERGLFRRPPFGPEPIDKRFARSAPTKSIALPAS